MSDKWVLQNEEGLIVNTIDFKNASTVEAARKLFDASHRACFDKHLPDSFTVKLYEYKEKELPSEPLANIATSKKNDDGAEVTKEAVKKKVKGKGKDEKENVQGGKKEQN